MSGSPHRVGRRNRAALELAAANLVYAAVQLILILVLARQTTVAEVGTFALALAITGPVHLAFGMRLRTVRVVDRSSSQLPDYYLAAIISGLLAMLVVLLCSWPLIADRERLVVVLVLSFAKFLEGLVDIHYGELQRQNEIRQLATTQVVRALVGLTLFALGVYLHGGALGGASGLAIAWFLMVSYQLTSGQVAWSHRNIRGVRGIVTKSWPLGVAAALNSLNTNASRLVAGLILGTYGTGIVAIISYPGAVISIVSNSLGQATLASLSAAHNNGNRREWRRLTRTLVICILTVSLIMVTALLLRGEQLLAMIFGNEYSPYVQELLLFLAAAVMTSLGTVQYYVLVAQGVLKQQGVVAAVTALAGLPLLVVIAMAEGTVMGVALGALVLSVIQFTAYLGAILLQRRKHPSESPSHQSSSDGRM